MKEFEPLLSHAPNFRNAKPRVERHPIHFAAPQVDFVLGHHRAARFLRRNNRGFDLLNATLMNPKSPRFDARSRAEWDAQKFAAKCIGCHMTGVDPASLRPFETFVGCEACHGPYDDRHTGGTVFMHNGVYVESGIRGGWGCPRDFKSVRAN